MDAPSSLFLVDGSSFIHRAYHAVRPLTSRSGVPTNAVYGFVSMLVKLLAEGKPTHVGVAFDGPPSGTFRAEIYPEYKAQRPPAPEDLIPQFELCRRVTAAFNIPVLEDHRVEADDILATLAVSAAREGFEVTIVTSDKDLMQLVGPRVQIWDTMKDKRFDASAVKEKLGVLPGQVRDLLALTGDASDNVPGVAGIGPKTAVALLEEHGDLEGVLAAAPRIKGKRGQTLVEQAERARLSARLVSLKMDVELPLGLEGLRRRPVDLTAVAQLFEELDFSRMMVQVRAFAAKAGKVEEWGPVVGSAVTEPDAKGEKGPAPGPARGPAPAPAATSLGGGAQGTAALWDAVFGSPGEAPASPAGRRDKGASEGAEPPEVAEPRGVEAHAQETPGDAGTAEGDEEITPGEPRDGGGAIPGAQDGGGAIPGAQDGEGAPITPEPAQGSASAVPLGVVLDRSRYETITSLDRLEAVLALAADRGALAVDLETTSLRPPDADIVGVSLCWGPGEAGYVPVGHRGLALGPQPKLEEVLARLRPLLGAELPRLYMQNHKYETAVFLRYGVPLAGVGCDPMIASYLLDASEPSHGLDALAARELGHRMITFKEVCGTGKSQRPFDEVEIDLATRYSAEDAEATFLLAERLEPRVKDAGLESLMRDVEIPLARVLALMELHGVALDSERLSGLSADMSRQLLSLEQQVEEVSGMRVNLASPKQLQVLLFEHLGLKPLRKTKTGHSTDAEVLEQLAGEHPVAALLHEHRQIQKLKGTYVDALPRLICPRTGRLHTSYNQAVAATGRLSSSEPNLQNIPIRTELGREIRRAFVAPEGHVLVSADYSQIELRVLAHLSGDEGLLEAFARGEDVHGRTAAEVFGVASDAVDREQRRVAKAVNFGVIYGQGAFGLARQLKISRAVAQAYIDLYFIRHPGVQTYMDRVIEEAMDSGMATTILGRRRPLGDLRSRNPNLRAAAERMARNTPIQGSAADIIKLAMLRCQARLERDFPAARMLLTVHDELVFEVPEEGAEVLVEAVRQEMSQAFSLSVALVVDVGTGRDWLAAH